MEVEKEGSVALIHMKSSVLSVGVMQQLMDALDAVERSVCLCVCLSVYASVCFSVFCLFIFLFVCVSLCSCVYVVC